MPTTLHVILSQMRSGTALYCGVVICALTSTSSLIAETDIVIATRNGSIRGRVSEGTAVFKGIPYAAPPIGTLRWREPMPPQTWKGLREAREFGPPCAQADRGWNHDLAKISSEDCLTLNTSGLLTLLPRVPKRSWFSCMAARIRPVAPKGG